MTGAQPAAGSAGPSTDPGPPPPEVPPSPRAPRSTTAAALLNLTGLGLGFAYLGRWIRAALNLAGTVGLVALAGAGDPASRPWLWRGIALVWLGAMALAGAWLARRHGAPARGADRAAAVLAGVVAVVAVFGTYLVYGAAEHGFFSQAVAAQGRADCATAERGFAAVIGPFRLTLSPDVADAVVRQAECTAFRTATDAQARGDRAAAVADYEGFRRNHPHSSLIPSADDNLASLYLAQAADATTELAPETGQARAATTRVAFEELLRALGLGATPAAGQVLAAMHTTFEAAEAPFTEQRFCEALPVLDYAVTLPDAETEGIAETASGHRAQAMLGCGLDEFRAGSFPAAVAQLQALVDAYPQDAGVPQAQAALIAAAVARQTTDPIPVPAPLDRPGALHVTFYSVTSSDTTVQLTGSSAASFTLPGCGGGCPATHDSADGCPSDAGKPSHTVQVDPGLYHVLLSSGPGDTGSVHTVAPIDGDSYCVYATPSPLDVPPPVVPTG